MEECEAVLVLLVSLVVLQPPPVTRDLMNLAFIGKTLRNDRSRQNIGLIMQTCTGFRR
jgi:hypothetical protein